jgi:hypothetical protein
LTRDLGRVGRGVFPPAQVAEAKAPACELPAERGVTLSRWSSAELAREPVIGKAGAPTDLGELAAGARFLRQRLERDGGGGDAGQVD